MNTKGTRIEGHPKELAAGSYSIGALGVIHFKKPLSPSGHAQVWDIGFFRERRAVAKVYLPSSAMWNEFIREKASYQVLHADPDNEMSGILAWLGHGFLQYGGGRLLPVAILEHAPRKLSVITRPEAHDGLVTEREQPNTYRARIDAATILRDVLPLYQSIGGNSSLIAHRDPKPDNIMFRENEHAVLIDFNIARVDQGVFDNVQSAIAAQAAGLVEGGYFDPLPEGEILWGITGLVPTQGSTKGPAFYQPASLIENGAAVPTSSTDLWGLAATLHAVAYGCLPWYDVDSGRQEGVPQSSTDRDEFTARVVKPAAGLVPNTCSVLNPRPLDQVIKLILESSAGGTQDADSGLAQTWVELAATAVEAELNAQANNSTVPPVVVSVQIPKSETLIPTPHLAVDKPYRTPAGSPLRQPSKLSLFAPPPEPPPERMSSTAVESFFGGIRSVWLWLRNAAGAGAGLGRLVIHSFMAAAIALSMIFPALLPWGPVAWVEALAPARTWVAVCGALAALIATFAIVTRTQQATWLRVARPRLLWLFAMLLLAIGIIVVNRLEFPSVWVFVLAALVASLGVLLWHGLIITAIAALAWLGIWSPFWLLNREITGTEIALSVVACLGGLGSAVLLVVSKPWENKPSGLPAMGMPRRPKLRPVVIVGVMALIASDVLVVLFDSKSQIVTADSQWTGTSEDQDASEISWLNSDAADLAVSPSGQIAVLSHPDPTLSKISFLDPNVDGKTITTWTDQPRPPYEAQGQESSVPSQGYWLDKLLVTNAKSIAPVFISEIDQALPLAGSVAIEWLNDTELVLMTTTGIWIMDSTSESVVRRVVEDLGGSAVDALDIAGAGSLTLIAGQAVWVTSDGMLHAVDLTTDGAAIREVSGERPLPRPEDPPASVVKFPMAQETVGLVVGNQLLSIGLADGMKVAEWELPKAPSRVVASGEHTFFLLRDDAVPIRWSDETSLPELTSGASVGCQPGDKMRTSKFAITGSSGDVDKLGRLILLGKPGPECTSSIWAIAPDGESEKLAGMLAELPSVSTPGGDLASTVGVLVDPSQMGSLRAPVANRSVLYAAGTEMGRLLRWSADRSTVAAIADLPPDGVVNGLAFDQTGALWASTWNAIWRMSDDGVWQEVIDAELASWSKQDPLADQGTLEGFTGIASAQDGLLWASGWGGLLAISSSEYDMAVQANQSLSENLGPDDSKESQGAIAEPSTGGSVPVLDPAELGNEWYRLVGRTAEADDAQTSSWSQDIAPGLASGIAVSAEGIPVYVSIGQSGAGASLLMISGSQVVRSPFDSGLSKSLMNPLAFSISSVNQVAVIASASSQNSILVSNSEGALRPVSGSESTTFATGLVWLDPDELAITTSLGGLQILDLGGSTDPISISLPPAQFPADDVDLTEERRAAAFIGSQADMATLESLTDLVKGDCISRIWQDYLTLSAAPTACESPEATEELKSIRTVKEGTEAGEAAELCNADQDVELTSYLNGVTLWCLQRKFQSGQCLPGQSDFPVGTLVMPESISCDKGWGEQSVPRIYLITEELEPGTGCQNPVSTWLAVLDKRYVCVVGADGGAPPTYEREFLSSLAEGACYSRMKLPGAKQDLLQQVPECGAAATHQLVQAIETVGGETPSCGSDAAGSRQLGPDLWCSKRVPAVDQCQIARERTWQEPVVGPQVVPCDKPTRDPIWNLRLQIKQIVGMDEPCPNPAALRFSQNPDKVMCLQRTDAREIIDLEADAMEKLKVDSCVWMSWETIQDRSETKIVDCDAVEAVYRVSRILTDEDSARRCGTAEELAGNGKKWCLTRTPKIGQCQLADSPEFGPPYLRSQTAPCDRKNSTGYGALILKLVEFLPQETTCSDPTAIQDGDRCFVMADGSIPDDQLKAKLLLVPEGGCVQRWWSDHWTVSTLEPVDCATPLATDKVAALYGPGAATSSCSDQGGAISEVIQSEGISWCLVRTPQLGQCQEGRLRALQTPIVGPKTVDCRSPLTSLDNRIAMSLDQITVAKDAPCDRVDAVRAVVDSQRTACWVPVNGTVVQSEEAQVLSANVGGCVAELWKRSLAEMFSIASATCTDVAATYRVLAPLGLTSDAAEACDSKVEGTFTYFEAENQTWCLERIPQIGQCHSGRFDEFHPVAVSWQSTSCAPDADPLDGSQYQLQIAKLVSGSEPCEILEDVRYDFGNDTWGCLRAPDGAVLPDRGLETLKQVPPAGCIQLQHDFYASISRMLVADCAGADWTDRLVSSVDYSTDMADICRLENLQRLEYRGNRVYCLERTPHRGSCLAAQPQRWNAPVVRTEAIDCNSTRGIVNFPLVLTISEIPTPTAACQTATDMRTSFDDIVVVCLAQVSGQAIPDAEGTIYRGLAPGDCIARNWINYFDIDELSAVDCADLTATDRLTSDAEFGAALGESCLEEDGKHLAERGDHRWCFEEVVQPGQCIQGAFVAETGQPTVNGRRIDCNKRPNSGDIKYIYEVVEVRPWETGTRRPICIAPSLVGIDFAGSTVCGIFRD